MDVTRYTAVQAPTCKICKLIFVSVPNQNFRVGGRSHDGQTRLVRYVALMSVELDPDMKVI